MYSCVDKQQIFFCKLFFIKAFVSHLETITSSFSSRTARPGTRLPDADVDKVGAGWMGRDVCEEWSLEEVALQNSTPIKYKRILF